jgi:hypothetical protein
LASAYLLLGELAESAPGLAAPEPAHRELNRCQGRITHADQVTRSVCQLPSSCVTHIVAKVIYMRSANTEDTLTATLEARTTQRRARALVVVAAIVAPVLVWAVVTYALGITITVPESPGSDARIDLAFAPVLFAATMSVLAGWGLLALLERFVRRRALAIWTTVAVIVFLVTQPYGPGFTLVERFLLALIHLVLAAVLIVGLRRTSPSRP